MARRLELICGVACSVICMLLIVLFLKDVVSINDVGTLIIIPDDNHPALSLFLSGLMLLAGCIAAGALLHVLLSAKTGLMLLRWGAILFIVAVALSGLPAFLLCAFFAIIANFIAEKREWARKNNQFTAWMAQQPQQLQQTSSQ